MNVKEKILKVFDENKGAYISGGQLAETLGVSRNAIWKAVKSLQNEGYKIDAVPNRGYCMDDNTDILSEVSIEKYLKASHEFEVKVFKTIDSTNTALKEQGAFGAKEGTLYVSEEQTAGRGRMNRRFESPNGTGVYFSLLLRPNISARESLFITTAAAVAVAMAIEKVSGQSTEIKWVNDIYMKSKKVCGILTEATFDMESGGIDYAVLGIGINVSDPKGGFPKEVKNIAGSILGKEDNIPEDFRSRIVAETMNYFMEFYRELSNRTFLYEYRRHSMIIGKQVYIIDSRAGSIGSVEDIIRETGKEPPVAKALAIDDECALVVEFPDGSRKTLSTGEVSIRKA